MLALIGVFPVIMKALLHLTRAQSLLESRSSFSSRRQTIPPIMQFILDGSYNCWWRYIPKTMSDDDWNGHGKRPQAGWHRPQHNRILRGLHDKMTGYQQYCTFSAWKNFNLGLAEASSLALRRGLEWRTLHLVPQNIFVFSGLSYCWLFGCWVNTLKHTLKERTPG